MAFIFEAGKEKNERAFYSSSLLSIFFCMRLVTPKKHAGRKLGSAAETEKEGGPKVAKHFGHKWYSNFTATVSRKNALFGRTFSFQQPFTCSFLQPSAATAASRLIFVLMFPPPRRNRPAVIAHRTHRNSDVAAVNTWEGASYPPSHTPLTMVDKGGLFFQRSTSLFLFCRARIANKFDGRSLPTLLRYIKARETRTPSRFLWSRVTVPSLPSVRSTKHSCFPPPPAPPPPRAPLKNRRKEAFFLWKCLVVRTCDGLTRVRI